MNKQEYLKQSREIGLPSRCPILEYCRRHALTIYFYSDYSDIDYNNNLYETLRKENAIPSDYEEKEINIVSEPPTWSKGKTNGMFTGMCPEVNLFDTENGLPMARGLACTDGVWDIELKKPEQFKNLESKHYSECLEFSKHFYENKAVGQVKKSTKTTKKFCYTYLMLDNKSGLHKIGMSNDPNYREKTLRSEDPKIKTIAKRKFATRKLALELENHLHEFYSHKRVRGEWFDLNAKEVDEIIKLLNE